MEIAVHVDKPKDTELKLWLHAYLLKGYFVVVGFEKYSTHNRHNRHRVFFQPMYQLKSDVAMSLGLKQILLYISSLRMTMALIHLGKMIKKLPEYSQ